MAQPRPQAGSIRRRCESADSWYVHTIEPGPRGASEVRRAFLAPLLRLHRCARLGTIDLRVDYLRPAISSHFEPAAEVLRLDSRAATVRMEFRDAESRLLSTGSAAYIVS